MDENDKGKEALKQLVGWATFLEQEERNLREHNRKTKEERAEERRNHRADKDKKKKRKMAEKSRKRNRRK